MRLINPLRAPYSRLRCRDYLMNPLRRARIHSESSANTTSSNAQAYEHWLTDKADIRSNARMQLSFMMAYGFAGLFSYYQINQEINKKLDARNQEINKKLDARNQEINKKLDARNQEINKKLDASNQELKASFDEKLKLNVDLLTVQLSEIKAILRERQG
ncbi:hypothetical protein L211DRAFT_851214 [Terfezia boudieri ATCC MYA-4762]|uniref:Uncharacterized protein n=1 Tax=Terfezia boudieri ATCC MYA-4762 TaxID=1051890 RepID=A0A3N4LJV2_9PEZI|nr:hypothetical protein L211DRAFT_851214 [Terfezia boudieri ATCC MYA-4762]